MMDIDMPEKNGHQTTIEIQQYYRNRNMRKGTISACSAYVQECEKNKAKQSGMGYYITKPVNPKLLE